MSTGPSLIWNTQNLQLILTIVHEHKNPFYVVFVASRLARVQSLGFCNFGLCGVCSAAYKVWAFVTLVCVVCALGVLWSQLWLGVLLQCYKLEPCVCHHIGCFSCWSGPCSWRSFSIWAGLLCFMMFTSCWIDWSALWILWTLLHRFACFSLLSCSKLYASSFYGPTTSSMPGSHYFTIFSVCSLHQK